MSKGRKVITKNRKAHRDYLVKDRYDAGLVLLGSEIKSIRNHNINIGDGFVQEKEGELWLLNTHIAPYKEANIFGHTDPRRPRKLLLHRREINRIITRIRQNGMTAIPLAGLSWSAAGRKWRSASRRARSATTNALTWQSAMPTGRLSAR